MACGLKNRVMVVRCNEVGHLSDPLAEVDFDKELPSRLALHPNQVDIICGLEEGCVHYKLNAESKQGEAGKEEKDEEVDEVRLKLEKSEQSELASMKEQKAVTFNSYGTMLAMGGEDGVMRIFSWPEMKQIGTTIQAHKKSITDLAWSPDGLMVVSVSQEQAQQFEGAGVWTVRPNMTPSTTIQQDSCVWDMKTCKGLSGSHRGAAFAESGMLFTGFNSSSKKGPDAFLMRWIIDEGETVSKGRVVAHHEGKITALAASPNGAAVATATSEGEVCVFQAKTLSKLVRINNVHAVFVTSLAFSPDSSRILSTSGDTSVHIGSFPKSPLSSLSLPIFVIILMAVIAYIVQRYLQATSITRIETV